MIRQQEQEDAIKLVCIFYCVHTIPCASYTVGSGHTMCIIYSMISTNDLFSDPGIVSPAMFTFDSIWSVCAQICTRPPPLKIHFLCQHQDLCIPDSEEIDPVYFEKVNLGAPWDIIQHWRQEHFQTGKRKAARHH